VNGGGRQKQLLIVLVALLLIAAWRYFGRSSHAAAPAPQAARRATDEEGGETPRARTYAGEEHKKARPGDRVAELRVADLDRPPLVAQPGRDPWRFIDPPPPRPPEPPKPRPLTAEELAAQEEARRRAAEAARLAAIEAAKPKPAEFTWQYLGNFGPADRRIAVFSDGKKVYNALEGDTLEKKFIVAHIGLESVDIRFVGFPDWPAKRVAIKRR
jgi:hypothetical protein